MSIEEGKLYVPQPTTVRAQPVHLSYDKHNDRIVYANGKSIVIRPVEPNGSDNKVQFTKHVNGTTVAAFSPLGNYVASGDEAGNVKIWDSSVFNTDKTPFEQPTVKSEFQVLSGSIRAIAWDADNSRIIAVGSGSDKFGHCFTWDLGNSIGEIQGHSETINAVALKPQRPYRAATAGDDKAMVFFTGPPFKFDKSVRGNHTNSIKDVQFSPDGKYVITVGADRAIVVYDGKTGEFVHSIADAHTGGIYGLSWYPDSESFVTASADNTVKKWTVDGWKLVKTYTVDSGSVENQQVGVAVTPKYIVSLSLNGNFNYFEDLDSPSVVVGGPQKSITAIELADGSLYVGTADGALYNYSIDEGIGAIPTAVDAKLKHTNYVVKVLKTDSAVVSAGWDDTLKVWDGTTLKQTVKLSGQPKDLVNAGENLVVLYESHIELYDSSYAKVAETKLSYTASSVSYVPGSKILVANTSANKVEEYSIGGDISHVKSFPASRSPPTLIKVSPNGEYAAVADSFGKYTLYKTSDASVVTTRWAFHSSKVIDAAWTEDSKYLLSGGLDSGLFIYSVEKPSRVIKKPLAHQNGISGLKWLKYGEEGEFVSSGLDSTLKTWTVKF